MRLQTTEKNELTKTKNKVINQSKKIVEFLPYKIIHHKTLGTNFPE